MVKKHIQQLRQQQLFKYLIAGGTAFGSEYVSFLLLFYVFDLPIVLSNTVSFLVGFFVSFFFNRSWTFKADRQYKWAAHHQLTGYLLLALLNLVASNVLLLIFHNFVPAVIGKFLAAACIACWNFFIFRLTIFSIAKPSDDEEN